MGVTIRPAGPADVGRANAALAALSADLGDPHPTRDADLAAALFGPDPAAHAVLAVAEGDGALAGIAVFSPQYSTKRAAAGLYVSDLWVAHAWRGAGLGARLLAAARDTAGERWGAGFLRLTAYATSPGALRFYRRLGFAEDAGAHHLTIEGRGLAALGGTR